MSLLVWRDAKTDPPTGDMERYVLFVDYEQFVEMVTAREVVGACDPDALWAELPVVSDLTDEDVHKAADELRLLAGDNALDGVPGAEELYQSSDRLRAALGGEKEET